MFYITMFVHICAHNTNKVHRLMCTSIYNSKCIQYRVCSEKIIKNMGGVRTWARQFKFHHVGHEGRMCEDLYLHVLRKYWYLHCFCRQFKGILLYTDMGYTIFQWIQANIQCTTSLYVGVSLRMHSPMNKLGIFCESVYFHFYSLRTAI